MTSYVSGVSMAVSLCIILIGILITKLSLTKDNTTKILLLSIASVLFISGITGMTFGLSENYYNIYSQRYNLSFGECLGTASQMMSILGAASVGSIALYINRKSK